ncbi:hypothetical protein Leryth_007155 [Lithospermum erythrorhizon]|nr:hypothetical protein Leryth_007155 [Lithospermum erythrorhizon]
MYISLSVSEEAILCAANRDDSLKYITSELETKHLLLESQALKINVESSSDNNGHLLSELRNELHIALAITSRL